MHLRIRVGLCLQKKVGALCFLDHVSICRVDLFVLNAAVCSWAGKRVSGVGTRGFLAHAGAMALARGAGSSVIGVLVDIVDARSAQADHLRRLDVAQTEATVTGRAAQLR